jgi:putative ABC transport system substrate-binding protein
MPDVFTIAHRAPIISAAARNNVPAVYSGFVYVRGGGLLSYGVDRVDLFRRAATYVVASCAARSRAISRCSFRRNMRWP